MSRLTGDCLRSGVMAGGKEGSSALLSRQEAIRVAYCLFDSILPDALVRQVDARLVLKHWIVNFWKLLPPNVVESPGLWTIYVEAKTGEAKWLHEM